MAVSNRSISDSKIKPMGFDGKWLASFGNVPDYGVWFVYGGSGSGKTSFIMQLAKYLTSFGNVFFNSLEMSFIRKNKKLIKPADFKIAWDRVNMSDVEGKINADTEQLDKLRVRLSAKRSPQIVIIDSLQYIRLSNTGRRAQFGELVDFFNQFHDKLFIISGHADGKEPRKGIGVDMMFHASVKVYVDGYKAFIRSRFPVDENWTSEPFVIWEQGANIYHVDKI